MPQDIYNAMVMSAASAPVSQEHLTRLLQERRRENVEHGVTGLLVYANAHWIDYMEGPREVVQAQVLRVRRDANHRDVEVMKEGPAPTREFADWSMAFVDFATPQVRALPGYSTFLEEPLDWNASGQAAPGHEMLDYFKAIMLAPNDSISGLTQSADIQQRTPAFAGKMAAAKRKG